MGFFLKKFEKIEKIGSQRIEKIGYHSHFNFEYNTERGFKESLSIALGLYVMMSFVISKNSRS